MNKIKVILILLTVFSSVMAGNVSADISLTERQTLIDLYNSTNGDNWINNSEWKEPPLHSDGFAMPGKENDWYGVICNNNHVEQLILFNNNLIGTIPASIKNLTYLEFCSLAHNQLKNIPAEIGELSNIRFLMLNNSQLAGPVPKELMNLIKLADSGSDFSYNFLCTADSDLRDFLNRKQIGGDWESSQSIHISSAIIVLQVVAGLEPDRTYAICDMNRDSKIGLEEAIYIIQKIAELR